MTRTWLIVVEILALSACRSEPAAAPRKRAAPPARGLAAGQPALARAVRAVVADCKLTADGRIEACGSQAEPDLLVAERAAGPREALRTYCRALEEQAPAVRALTGSRLARLGFAGTLRRAASVSLLECLLAGVQRVDPSLRTALARAAGLMAPALKREEAVLRAFARSPELRAAAVQAFFVNGRLAELSRLQRLLREERDPRVLVAIVRGFGEAPLEPAEVEPVCRVIAAALTARQPIAGAAATTHALVCLEQGDDLLAAAEQLAGRSALTLEVLTAVHAVTGLLERRGSPEQRRRSVALLDRVVRDADLEEPLREAALEHLAAIDRAAALRAARRLRAKLGPAPRRPTSAPSSQPRPSSLRDRVELLLQKR